MKFEYYKRKCITHCNNPIISLKEINSEIKVLLKYYSVDQLLLTKFEDLSNYQEISEIGAFHFESKIVFV